MLTINECYKKFVQKIINEGCDVYKDDKDHIRECIGNYYYIDDPLNLKYSLRYKNFTTNDLLKYIKDEMFEMKNNPIKSDALYSYVKSAENSELEGFVYTYPNRLFKHFNINQFETMENRLLNALGSNRAVAVTIDPVIDSTAKDIPCLQFLQYTIRDNELAIHCLFRSNDIYGAFYSNMYFITYLGLLMKDRLNDKLLHTSLNFTGIHYHSTSAHIYHNDLKAARRIK